MRSLRYPATILLSVIVVALAFGLPGVCQDKKSEEELGRKYAKQAEESMTLADDPALIERVQRIGNALAKIANSVEVPAQYGSSEIYKFDYEFKVVNDEDVNAFSLPGGRIYVNTGLLEMCETDDELAGVIAHEIAHAAHHHMPSLIKKQAKADRYIALAALAGVLANVRNHDLNNILYGAQLYKIGALSGYTQEAEKDADRTAVAYLARSPYNPEGMLTFMKKLDEKHESNPSQPLGIFQTHPRAFQRVANIGRAMQEEGLDVNLRKLRDIAYAKCEPVAEGSDRYRVVVNSRVVCEPASLDSGTPSKQRAEEIANAINKVIGEGICTADLCEDVSRQCLTARGADILKIEAEDLRSAGMNSEALLDKARSAVAYAVWADWLWERCELDSWKVTEGSY